MKLLRCFVVVLFCAMTCSAAELPKCYQSMNRVTWIVQNVDRVSAAWKPLGLSDIKDSPHVRFTGEYRGKPVTILAHEVTGQLGNITVDFIQPDKGEVNAFSSFLSSHGDGIFSFVFEVSSKEEMDQEIQRMSSLGVDVAQQLTVKENGKPVTFTYFNTEPQGKYSLGLVCAGCTCAHRKNDDLPLRSCRPRDSPCFRVLAEAWISANPDRACDAQKRHALSRQAIMVLLRCRLPAY